MGRGPAASLPSPAVEALKRRVLRARPPAHAGRLAEVEAELRECLDEAEGRFADGHIVTQLALCELSIGLLKAHRTVEAEAGFRRLRSMMGSPVRKAHVHVLRIHAVSLSRVGRHEEAEREYAAFCELLSEHFDALNPLWLALRSLRVEELCHLRRFEEAEARAVIERSVFAPASGGLFVRWMATNARPSGTETT
jgi:hypothetical protein